MLLLYKQRTTWILVVVIQPYNRLLLVIYNIDMSHANKDNQDSESSQGTNFFYKTKPIGDRHFVHPRILVSLQLASWDLFSFCLTSRSWQHVNKSQLATCKLTRIQGRTNCLIGDDLVNVLKALSYYHCYCW